ncbi:mitochondrial 30S ribosomal protein S19 [Epithele typhae]|uniref:mitochondrial 30S ribosomal protein S19 n=1 Tax=Epithele typhae TaxID=378194 RepID=UPI00200862F5|nr:mitochondrial 30S ribosomal protein S19 [Epithele typhae]XP_047873277.1 mitochondrial 30S ribosomal protein S19 [Epithele typhae]KAH9916305.1 mitochondrial 30S ribosomal protein S19 [Epithele typhae]KAH9916382.1 mitochondrial 30S ribosomal protein S19 [Epithele typhae]
MFVTAIAQGGRSAWKGPYFVAFSNLKHALENNIPIRTQARACTILPNFVGIRFLVHNGKEYLPVNVTQDMVGHKLGEFAITRKRFSYKHTKNK